MALTRLVAGLTNMRDDVTPSADGLNLAIDLGVVALAVFLLLKDRTGQSELLATVARELGEAPVDAADGAGDE